VQVTLSLTDEQFERIAERAAELIAARQLDTTTTSDGDGFLNVAGAAAFLAAPESRIYSLVSAKRIPHHRDGSRLLFDRDELREFVKSGGAKRT